MRELLKGLGQAAVPIIIALCFIFIPWLASKIVRSKTKPPATRN